MKATTALFLTIAWVFGPSIGAATLTVATPEFDEGRSWTVVELHGADALPRLGTDWQSRVMWDLRPAKAGSRLLVWRVSEPADVGLRDAASTVGADRALCASDRADSQLVGCRLFRSNETGASGPAVRWSNYPGDLQGAQDLRPGLPAHSTLATGIEFQQLATTRDGQLRLTRSHAVGEGIVLTKAGPLEALLLEESFDDKRRYRFVSSSGLPVAVLEGEVADGLFVLDRAEVLLDHAPEADDGLTIPFLAFREALVPGQTGFLQYSNPTDMTPLTSVNPAWTSVPEMISIDQTSVPYQPDPSDPASLQSLPEVWDFTGLDTATLNFRTFNTTRDEASAASCFSGCTTRDVTATPPDGTWQAYLKIDQYQSGGSLYTQSFFALNDNDTGANPSIDVPFTIQDALNSSDATQVCFEASAGGASRFLRFFTFNGATPATAEMAVGDVWNSGNWTSCSDGNGLRLTAASQCGVQCYPGCSIPTPRAQGRLAGNAGFRMTVLEDGWVHMPTGNYIPALLMRQDTDLLAGLDFIGSCVLGATPNRAFDYFWVSESYPLLALVSSVSNETMPADDWSSVGNITDGADFAWGPYPPFQFETTACLSGTNVRWELPADGSNLNGEPGLTDYGYVVSWGSLSDPEELADPSTNPNHSPFLAAPAGSEPTSYTITGWAPSSINVTVTTQVDYTDPDLADTRTYRSAAYYKSTKNPATLSSGSFVVGNGATPFSTRNGADIDLAWPAVTDADSYRIRVYDLSTKLEIACPAGMNCTPTVAATSHPGGAADANDYGYRAFAVDACGEASLN